MEKLFSFLKQKEITSLKYLENAEMQVKNADILLMIWFLN
jgi:hypothetical protein